MRYCIKNIRHDLKESLREEEDRKLVELGEEASYICFDIYKKACIGEIQVGIMETIRGGERREQV